MEKDDRIWAVYGEDPNCDLGGSHHTPLLGYFRGTHDAVLAHAKTLKNWTTWGSGGRIVEVVVEDVDSAAHNKKQLDEIEKKIAELEELKLKIKHYR